MAADTTTLAARYRQLERRIGACPIEAGFLGRLVDHECKHGRLAGDRTEACGCWPSEAKLIELRPSRVTREQAAEVEREAA
jgi:hypothetical protein